MTYDLISIIIPLYNKEKYISECLLSLLDQTYPYTEIIIVDDGSNDDSLSVVRKISKDYNNVHIISQENGGRSSARNNGLNHVSGKYVVMVDADDVVEQDYLENLYNYINVDKSDCVVCGMKIVGKKQRNVCCNKHSLLNIDMAFLYRYIATNGLNLGTSCCNKLFKYSIIQDNNIKFINIDVGEDYLFCLDYARHSNTWSTIDKALYHYNQHDDSTMHDKGRDLTNKIYAVYDSIEGFIEQNGFIELYEALYASYIKLVFKETIRISYIDDWKNRKRLYQKTLNDKKNNVILKNACTKDMTKRYRLFYCVYRLNSSIMLEIFAKSYRLFFLGGE